MRRLHTGWQAYGALVLGMLAASVSTPALAQDKKDKVARVAVVERLIDCRTVVDDAARLACFDKQVAELASARDKREVVFADRATVEETRKGLFGFNLPKNGLFDSEGRELDELTTTIAKATRGADGKWVFRLPDGAKWVQIDDREPPQDPKAGDTLVIRKGALGSFMGSVNDRRSIRIRREN